MSGTYFGRGTCCLPNAEGIVYLKVGPHSAVVGMMGLETVFQELQAMDRRPEEATDMKLLGMARKFNYIPERATVEADYATILREAYAHFCARGVKDERQT